MQTQYNHISLYMNRGPIGVNFEQMADCTMPGFGFASCGLVTTASNQTKSLAYC